MLNLDDDVKKRSFVRILNTDNKCLPRAIIVQIARLLCEENPNSRQYAKHLDRIGNSRNRVHGIQGELRWHIGIPVDKPGLLEGVLL